MAEHEADALAHDEALGLRIHNKPYPRWQGTLAEAFLKADISQNLQVYQKPKEQWVTRPEYRRMCSETTFSRSSVPAESAHTGWRDARKKRPKKRSRHLRKRRRKLISYAVRTFVVWPYYISLRRYNEHI